MPPRTILLVDDDPSILMVVEKMLKILKHTVISAKNGELALKQANSYEGVIDYAIIDYILPDIDGKQLMHELINQYPEMKIIISTGLGSSPEIQALLNEGAYAILSKPFSIKDLKETIV